MVGYIADRDLGAVTRAIEVPLAETDEALVVGLIKPFAIPSFLHGRSLSRAQLLITGAAGTGTGDTTVQLTNRRTGNPILSTPITVAPAATVGTPGVIDAGEAAVETDDIIDAEVLTNPDTTDPEGAILVAEYQ